MAEGISFLSVGHRDIITSYFLYYFSCSYLSHEQIFLFLCACFICMYVCTTCLLGACKGQKRAPDSSVLELQLVVRCRSCSWLCGVGGAAGCAVSEVLGAEPGHPLCSSTILCLYSSLRFLSPACLGYWWVVEEGFQPVCFPSSCWIHGASTWLFQLYQIIMRL